MFIIKHNENYVKFKNGKAYDVPREEATEFNSKKGAGWNVEILEKSNFKNLTIEEK